MEKDGKPKADDARTTSSRQLLRPKKPRKENQSEERLGDPGQRSGPKKGEREEKENASKSEDTNKKKEKQTRQRKVMKVDETYQRHKIPLIP